MRLHLKPKFSIGQKVYKVCRYCYVCKIGGYEGCGIGCREWHTSAVLETKVDGYQVVKNKYGKYEITYHIEDGSVYTYTHEKEEVLFKTREDAEKSMYRE